MKNRTGIDFSKHDHYIEIYNCAEKQIRIDHLKIPKSRMNYIQFINTSETLTVTGDFGNWVFCRPFIPSKDGYVSDGYWLEKLRMLSEQKLDKLDFKSIIKDIKEKINGGLVDYGYEGEELEKQIEWYTELLEVAEGQDELEYLYKAYRDNYAPDIDYEDIPCYKEIPVWLQIIFDGFDEICNRLNN